MEDYKPNSHLSKDQTEEHKMEKVVSGTVTKKKRSKFLETFVPGDVRDVKNYITTDVIVPTVKSLLYDTFTNGLKMFLFKEKGPVSRYGQSTPASTVAYHKFSEDKQPRSNYSISDRIGYEDPVLANRGDADAVLTRLEEAMAQYGVVSILDLYDLIGWRTNPSDNKYGWTDIRSARIDRNYDGTYTLKMPRPVPLD